MDASWSVGRGKVSDHSIRFDDDYMAVEWPVHQTAIQTIQAIAITSLVTIALA